MARARNIKPSFFTNDALAEYNCPLGRLLFIGLWTLADHNGNLEWRPKKIKVQLLPYDECDIEQLANNLDKSGFIRFYSDGDKIYLNVTNFVTHQNPHKNEREKGTDIPDYADHLRQLVDLKTLTINPDKSREEQEGSTSDPADSPFLNPDSLNPPAADAGESGSSGNENPPSDLPTPKEFSMALDWLPSEIFRERCHGSGISLDTIPKKNLMTAVGEFRSYWQGEKATFTQDKWEQKLLQKLIREFRGGDLEKNHDNANKLRGRDLTTTLNDRSWADRA